MSSIQHEIVKESPDEHGDLELREFSRLERMLLFAVINECDRCIKSEGHDCLCSPKFVSCPFVSIREEYGIRDIHIWKEMVQ